MPGGYRNPDFTNETFGALTLLKKFKEGQHWRWSCRCVCGKLVVRRQDYLIRERFKNLSCGCRHSGKLNSGSRSLNWRGHGEISAQYIGSVRHSAQLRGIPFEVSIEYLWKLFEAQGSLCALTGIPLLFVTGSVRNSRSSQTASLDRKDPSLGYVEGNLWWIHKAINLMKNHYETDVFVMLCNAVAAWLPVEFEESALDRMKGTRNPATARFKRSRPRDPTRGPGRPPTAK